MILIVVAVWAAVFSLPDEKVHIVFCDVGQGDAALLIKGQTQILIDGGPNSRVLDCLSEHIPFWDRKLEMVILSHPESDHMTGLIDVVARYAVEYLVAGSVPKDAATFWKLRDEVLKKDITVISPQRGDLLKMGDLSLAILWPAKQLGESLVWDKTSGASREKILGVSTLPNSVNDYSVVANIFYKDFDALFVGDIPSEIEPQITIDGNRRVEVLKVAHHGSKYSSASDFLKKINPGLAVISVGKNSYGHPASELLGRLGDFGIRTLRTDQEGDIEIVSDGSTWYNAH